MARCDASTDAASKAGNIVQSKFTSVQDVADSYVNDAKNSLAEAIAALKGVTFSFDAQDIDTAAKPTGVTVPTVPTAPTINDISVTLPEELEKYVSSGALDSLQLPVFDATLPDLDFGTAPDDLVWPEDPGEAPSYNEVDVPNAPTLTAPSEPVLSDIYLEDPPDVTLANFDGVRPAMDFSPPAHNFVYAEEPFNNDLLDTLKSQIESIFDNDGGMLSQEAEQALYARGRDRLLDEKETELLALETKYSQLGDYVPSGAYMAAREQLITQFSKRLQELVREIIVEQERLAAEGKGQALQFGNQYIDIAIGLHDKVANRMFQAAIYAADFGLKVFDAKVSHFKAQLEQYQVDATVYKTRIEGALLTMERWKALLEGAKLEGEVQDRLISVYNSKLAALKTYAELYNTEMAGAKLKAEVQKMGFEAYAQKISAYTARLQGNIARYDAYVKSLASEEAKVNLFTARANAYKSQVDAVAAAGNFEIERKRSEIEEWRLDKERIEHQFALLSEQAKIDIQNVQNNLAKYSEEVKQYSADTDFSAKLRASDVEAYKANVDENIQKARTAIEEARLNFEAFLASQKAISDLFQAVAQIAASIGSSAMNSFSTNVGYSYSGSDSFSCGYSEQKSESTNTNISI